MNATSNPLRSNPILTIARDRVIAGDLGQRLAVYAAARVRSHLDDPLAVLGLPLIDVIIASIGEQPVAVTALKSGGPGGFECWSLVLAFPSALRATIDLGAGLGHAQPGELDLRIEWSGAERVILVEPAAVAVTVSNSRGHHRRSAEVAPIAVALLEFAETAREIITNPPESWRAAAAVIVAARESAASNQRMTIVI